MLHRNLGRPLEVWHGRYVGISSHLSQILPPVAWSLSTQNMQLEVSGVMQSHAILCNSDMLHVWTLHEPGDIVTPRGSMGRFSDPLFLQRIAWPFTPMHPSTSSTQRPGGLYVCEFPVSIDIRDLTVRSIGLKPRTAKARSLLISSIYILWTVIGNVHWFNALNCLHRSISFLIVPKHA